MVKEFGHFRPVVSCHNVTGMLCDGKGNPSNEDILKYSFIWLSWILVVACGVQFPVA